jgi:hypothetical protein
MIRSTVQNQDSQKHWKEVFEGSLTQLNGGVIPASKQPIFKKPSTFGVNTTKDAIATAAASLAALWQISSPGRLQRS